MQLDLEFKDPKEKVLNVLSSHIKNLSSVKFTKNKTRILSANKIKGDYNIRIHHGFALAPTNVIEEIAKCILNRNKQSSHLIHEYFQSFIRKEYDTNNIKKREIKTTGNHFDLKQLLSNVNKRYFNDSINIDITWGYKSRKKKRFVKSRHITLGQYSGPENLIIIHPNLDKIKIPKFFIESVIYHEICHHIIGEKRSKHRRLIHTKEFKELENKFLFTKEAKEWEKNNFSYLIHNI